MSATSSGEIRLTPPRFGTHVTAGVLDEDLAHEPCGDAKEASLILPTHLVWVHQP
jgi:hypothetical protein